jgi:hypothetical protein
MQIVLENEHGFTYTFDFRCTIPCTILIQILTINLAHNCTFWIFSFPFLFLSLAVTSKMYILSLFKLFPSVLCLQNRYFISSQAFLYLQLLQSHYFLLYSFLHQARSSCSHWVCSGRWWKDVICQLSFLRPGENCLQRGRRWPGLAAKFALGQ